jgi:Ca-activated chloride channel family protein
VGVSDTAGLQRLAERKAQEANVFLTVLGFGRGNLNDEMMEAISNKGNGNYHYIDNSREARKVLIEQMSGTLVTIAKDVKIQIEFNPAQIAAYRLIGYENRVLAREDFDDDKKDAGEIGAGHAVTALYELVPTEVAAAKRDAEPLKYQDDPAEQTRDQPAVEEESRFEDELFTLKLRYKQPNGDTSTKIEFIAKLNGTEMPTASDDFQFAAAVASFGMLLRNSAHSGDATLESVLECAAAGRRNDPHGYRSEFVDMVRQAQQLCR